MIYEIHRYDSQHYSSTTIKLIKVSRRCSESTVLSQSQRACPLVAIVIKCTDKSTPLKFLKQCFEDTVNIGVNMETKEKRMSNKVGDLNTDGVVELLERCKMQDFVDFARAKKLDGRKLLDVSEGIVKLWRPKSNAKQLVAFIEELKENPEKFINVQDETRTNKNINANDIKDTVSIAIVDIESQYQTIPARKKEENTNTAHVNSTMNTVEELIRKLDPAKSFLYRNKQKTDKSPSYLPMDGAPKKAKKFFRLNSYEYPFFDFRARFLKRDTANDKYYSMKRNSRYYIHRSYKMPECRTKYKSLSAAEEMIEKYPEDHFYEDLNYNEIEQVQEPEPSTEKVVENRVTTVKPCIVKIQELFQFFKVPFFKRHEIEDKKVDIVERDVHIYENSDSIVNMYDSVRVNRESRENSVEKNYTKLPVEDYLEPVQLSKDYCDVSYPHRTKDDSLLGYIMSIFENRFGMRRGARLGGSLVDFLYRMVHCLTDVVAVSNESNHSDESDDDSHKAECTQSDVDAATSVRKSPDELRPVRTNMADRPLPVPVENEPFYMNIDRAESENLLRGQPDGTFVLRPSSQPNHAYTLSVSCANAVHNVGVRRRPDGRLALGFARRGERSFASVTSLLRHHRKRRLLLVAGGGLIGGTTLNDTPHYYQSPSNIPVHI